MMRPREELEAEILEYRHALEEVAAAHEDACPNCQIVAKGALGGLNREMMLELVREETPDFVAKLLEPVKLEPEDEEMLAQLLKRNGGVSDEDIVG